jgi:alanine-glyoxylate transaminase/serine-glyoxylate transaminase/serine-pyruvate transaminase
MTSVVTMKTVPQKDMNPPMVLGCLAGVEAALRVQGVPCGSGALDAAIQCLARA